MVGPRFSGKSTLLQALFLQFGQDHAGEIPGTQLAQATIIHYMVSTLRDLWKNCFHNIQFGDDQMAETIAFCEKALYTKMLLQIPNDPDELKAWNFISSYDFDSYDGEADWESNEELFKNMRTLLKPSTFFFSLLAMRKAGDAPFLNLNFVTLSPPIEVWKKLYNNEATVDTFRGYTYLAPVPIDHPVQLSVAVSTKHFTRDPSQVSDEDYIKTLVEGPDSTPDLSAFTIMDMLPEHMGQLANGTISEENNELYDVDPVDPDTKRHLLFMVNMGALHHKDPETGKTYIQLVDEFIADAAKVAMFRTPDVRMSLVLTNTDAAREVMPYYESIIDYTQTPAGKFAQIDPEAPVTDYLALGKLAAAHIQTNIASITSHLTSQFTKHGLKCGGIIHFTDLLRPHVDLTPILAGPITDVLCTNQQANTFIYNSLVASGGMTMEEVREEYEAMGLGAANSTNPSTSPSTPAPAPTSTPHPALSLAPCFSPGMMRMIFFGGERSRKTTLAKLFRLVGAANFLPSQIGALLYLAIPHRNAEVYDALLRSVLEMVKLVPLTLLEPGTPDKKDINTAKHIKPDLTVLIDGMTQKEQEAFIILRELRQYELEDLRLWPTVVAYMKILCNSPLLE